MVGQGTPRTSPWKGGGGGSARTGEGGDETRGKEDRGGGGCERARKGTLAGTQLLTDTAEGTGRLPEEPVQERDCIWERAMGGRGKGMGDTV
jgi:hypothetical protein